MVVFRPVRPDDLEQVLRLATLADYGLSTLPNDAKYLERRVRRSQRSFEGEPEEPGGEVYFFVLEDLDRSRIVGTSGIVSRVGGFEPFYMYEVKTVVHVSQKLRVRKEIRALHLVAQHDGPCEIGTLFLDPEYRQGGLGRFLSKSRFLFMADHREAFAPDVIAELRGVSDAAGRSPFWEAVGRHFFDIDFPTADYLSMVDKKFIAELMPTHPIYIPLLPGEVQEVIGQVHERTAPALKILQKEGFRPMGMVDIFDAGPVVRCALDRVRTVRESVEAVVEEVVSREVAGEARMVSNGRWDFRACTGALEDVSEGGVRIHRSVASALDVTVGDPVRHAPI